MTIYVKKFKKKDGNDCIALMCDNNKREKVLTFDRFIISDYLGLKRKDLDALEYGRTLILDSNVVGKE